MRLGPDWHERMRARLARLPSSGRQPARAARRRLAEINRPSGV
jgi:hypothetical protein